MILKFKLIFITLQINTKIILDAILLLMLLLLELNSTNEIYNKIEKCIQKQINK